MPGRTAIMQVSAPFWGAVGYVQVNQNHTLSVTFVTAGSVG